MAAALIPESSIQRHILTLGGGIQAEFVIFLSDLEDGDWFFTKLSRASACLLFTRGFTDTSEGSCSFDTSNQKKIVINDPPASTTYQSALVLGI